MCGRFTISVTYDFLSKVFKEEYQIEELNLDVKLPRYNVAPGQDVISIINDGKKYRTGTLRWGFVPFWAKDEKIGYKMINAKSETLATKPSFKHSFLNKRCIILADSFYEWKRHNNEKIPMRIHMKDQSLFSFAGLWSSKQREDGTKLYTCTIITTEPNDLVSDIHNRMPVILSKEAEKIWLDPTITDINILNSLLKPYDSKLMDAYQVSSIVNNAKNETPECIVPINT